jgi:tetratricopeptide (TPR) repeat protein
VLNVVPLYFQSADRYLSLPLVALAFGLARLVDAARLRVPANLLRAGCLLCLAALCVANVRYQSVWVDDVALWREATRNEPRAFYAWLQLGHALRDRGDYPGSMYAYESAVGTQPTLALGRSALFYAVALHELGDAARAAGLVARYQAALTRVDQLDLLARELITSDARNSAALVIQRILELGELTPAQLQALLTSARASNTPWVAKAIEVAIQGGQPATAALR